MGKKRTRRICRVLYAVAIAVSVISLFTIICSVLMITNGRLWAVLPLAIGIGLVWLADELAEAADRRIH